MAKQLSQANKKKLELLIKRILRDVKPTEEEARYATSIANEIMMRLKKAAPSNVEILLAGSVARGTHIRGDYDIDIFLLFPRATSKQQIEKKGLEIAKRIIDRKKGEKYIIKYAEHPYARLIMPNKNVTADIVPAYKIYSASERATSVDRTQLHNKFINTNMNQKQRDDVRVLKAFLLQHNIYGAEASTEGFSGYLCELMVYHYGNLINLLTNISEKPLPLILEPISSMEHHHTSNEAKRLCLKFNSRFIVLDPTDANRNVAANVSGESLARFVLSARRLVSDPNINNFSGAHYSDTNSKDKLINLSKRLNCGIYVFDFKVQQIAEDILWHQLKKANRIINSQLEKNNFKPVMSFNNIRDSDAVICFLINNIQSGSSVLHGPEAFMHEASSRFISAHKNAVISLADANIIAIVPSLHKTPQSLLMNIIKSKQIQLPSYINKNKATLYVDKIPEKYAKLVYAAYMAKISI